MFKISVTRKSYVTARGVLSCRVLSEERVPSVMFLGEAGTPVLVPDWVPLKRTWDQRMRYPSRKMT